MKQYHIILYIAFIAVLVSCKKENAPSVTAVNKTTQQKLQTWFESQSKLNPSGIQPVLGSNTPNWGETEFVEGENMFITPVVFNKNRNAAKYFVAADNGKDEFKNGRYYVVLNEAGGNLSSAENLIVSDIKNDVKQLGNFSGAVLEYDFNNSFVKSKHYKNGNETNQKDALAYKTKNNAVKEKEIAVSNLASCAEGEEQVCIDWYWQTYINGVLYLEEYVFTTCSCFYSGSGGGETNPGESGVCSMTATQAQNFINSISGSSTFSSELGLTLGNPVIMGNRKRAPFHGYGGGYILNLVFGMKVEWESEYSGWAYKILSNPNNPWLFESIKFEGFPKTDGSATACFSTAVTSLVHSEQITPDRLEIFTSGTCHIECSVVCIGGVIKTNHTGDFGAHFYSSHFNEAH